MGADYYALLGGSRILSADRTDQSGADDVNVIDWALADPFILALNLNSGGKETVAAQYKIRWRNVTQDTAFGDVTGTGEITFNATTSLVDGDPIAIGGRKCDVQDDDWQDGEENEGDNLCDSIDLPDDFETEIHWALDCSGATGGEQYEFELYDVTNGAAASRGTCGAQITMLSAVQALAGSVAGASDVPDKPLKRIRNFAAAVVITGVACAGILSATYNFSGSAGGGSACDGLLTVTGGGVVTLAGSAGGSSGAAAELSGIRGGYSHRKPFGIENAYVDSDQDEYPAYVTIVADTDIGGNMKDTVTYNDIRFTDGDGLTWLEYEVVYFDITTGVANAKIIVKSDLKASYEKQVYCYFGKTSDTDGQGDPYDSNYVSVWHGKNASTTTVADSKGSNTATKVGEDEPLESDGKLYKSQEYDGGNDCMRVGTAASLRITGNLTIEAWVEPDDGTPLDHQAIASRWDDSIKNCYWLRMIATTGAIRFAVRNSADTANGAATGVTGLSDSTWAHVVGVYNGIDLRVYKDGALDENGASNPASYSDGIYNDDTVNFDIGNAVNGVGAKDRFWNGEIEEIRISNTDRSADWIKFGFYNFTETGNEINWGLLESLTGTITLNGTAGGTSAVDADLWRIRGFSGTAGGGSSVAGDFERTLGLTGTAGGSSSADGELSRIRELSGTAGGGSGATGALTVTAAGGEVVTFAGAAGGASSADGILGRTLGLTGAAGGTSSADGILERTRRLAGSVAAAANIADVDLERVRELAGSILSTSSITGALATDRELTATIAGESTVSGALESTKGLSGSVAGASDVTGALSTAGLFKLFGSIAGTSNIPDTTMNRLREIAGGSINISFVEAGLSVSNALQGIVTAGSSADASLSLDREFVGETVQGQSSITGDLKKARSFTGAAAGASDITGDLTGTFSFIGPVEAQSAVNGTLTTGADVALRGVVGSASGVTGDLTGTFTLAGAVDSASSTTGALSANKALIGAVDSTSTVEADLGPLRGLGGSIGASSGIDGALYKTAGEALAGTVVAASNIPDVNLERSLGLIGAVAGASNITGRAEVGYTLAGNVAGESTIAGVLSKLATVGLAGSLDAASAVTGSAAIDWALSGQVNAQTGSEALMSAIYSLSGDTSAASSITGGLNRDRGLIGSVGASSGVTGSLKRTRSFVGSITAVTGADGSTKLLRGAAGSVAAISGASAGAGVLYSIAGATAPSSGVTGVLTVTLFTPEGFAYLDIKGYIQPALSIGAHISPALTAAGHKQENLSFTGYLK